MKRLKLLHYAVLIGVAICLGLNSSVSAQCTNIDQWPLTTVTIAHSCAPTIIAPDQWAEEYSVLSLTAAAAGDVYVFRSSVATDYLTLRSNTGTLLASGITPLTYTQPATPVATVQLHVNANAACGTQSSDRTTQAGLYINQSYTSATTTQPSIATAVAGITNVQVVRLDVVVSCTANPLTMSAISFDLGSTASAADIGAARVYYTGTSSTFSTTTQFGSAISTPTGAFTVAGAQALQAGTNYFFLVYDLPCAATTANVVDASVTGFTLGGTAYTPSTTNPAGTRAIIGLFATARTDVNSITAIAPGTLNAPFVYAAVTGSATCPATVTQLNFSVTALAGQVAQAKAYYSTTSTFNIATVIAFGTPVANPTTGSISFTGSQVLTTGINYFFLTYEVPCAASTAASLNGDIVSLVVNGATITPTGAGTSANAISVLYPTTKSDPNSSTALNAGSTNNPMVRATVTGSANCAGTVTQLNFSVSGTAPATDIAQARAYYSASATFSLATATQFGSAVNGPSGTISFTGAQPLVAGTGSSYFYLVYDLSCPATPINIVNADISSLVINGNTVTPTAATITPNAIQAVTISITKTDPNGTTTIPVSAQDAQVAYALIPASGTCTNTVTSITVNVNGTAASADIARAEMFYTTSATFTNAIPFGSAIINPATGTQTFTGSQLLSSTLPNYFWLVYDISCTASTLVNVNGNITSVTLNSVAITPTGSTPSANSIVANTGIYYSLAPGAWSSTGTWACGAIPPSATTPVLIGHAVTVSTTGLTAGAITVNSGGSLGIQAGGGLTTGTVTINSGGSLGIQAGSLTMGASSAVNATGNSNVQLLNNGTLDISGGTLNVNGGVAIASQFNMSGGILNIDPNDGTAATSYAGIPLSITTTALNVTGGAINMLDPAYNAAMPTIAYNLSGFADAVFGTGCTVTLGGGDDVNTVATQGFYVECTVLTGTLEIGTLVVNGGRYNAQRHMSTYTLTNYITKAKNLTINAGAEVVINTASLSVTGNLVNNGVITSTAAGGNLAMVGNALYSGSVYILPATTGQTISGSGYFKYTTAAADPTAQSGNALNALTVYHASASPGLTLNMPVTLPGSLSLVGGKVNTTAMNILALGTGTTITGNPATFTATTGALYDASGTSPISSSAYLGGWIVGPFNRYVTATTTTGQAGILPVGSDTSRPAQIIFTTAPTTGGYLTGTWVNGAGSTAITPALTESAVTPNTINAALNAIWRVVSAGTLTGGTYTGAFTYNNAAFIVNFANTTLIKRANAASPWTLQGTHVTTTGSNTNPTVQRTGLSGFSEFTLGGANGTVLPVTLTDLTARNAGKTNVIKWTTSVETGINSYEVQRSANGREFSTFTTQGARGAGNYTAIDPEPVRGMNYYRLRMPDANGGKADISKVVTAMVNSVNSIALSAYPNPVSDVVTVHVLASVAATLTLHDLHGRVVQSRNVDAAGIATFNMAGQPAGIYTITLKDGAQTEVIKVSKL